MRHCLIICALLLASCGPDAPKGGAIPADLLGIPQGYVGPTPQTEAELVGAALVTQRALGQCRAQIGAIAALQ